MNDLSILKSKKILIADDEPDVLETLRELLEMCSVDTAQNFDTAEILLNKTHYDLAIFDIMGVRGYDLLNIANQKGIPALMLTAHALNPNDFVKSIEAGAIAYLPKEKMAEIANYIADLLKAIQEGDKRPANWFKKLTTFFDRRFGYGWREKRKDFWDKYLYLLDE